MKNGPFQEIQEKIKVRDKHTFDETLYSMFIKSILIPTLILLLCFAIYSSYTMNQRKEQNIRDVLNSVSQNLEMQISDLENVESAFYIYNDVFREAEALNNPKLYENYDELSRQQLENRYTLTLTKLSHTSEQDIKAVVFFPISGGNNAYYLGKDKAELQQVKYSGYEEESWYQEAVSKEGKTIFYKEHIPSYMENKKGEEVYSYITSVRDMNSGKVIGVVKIDVKSQQLVQSLSVLERSEENGLAILKGDEYFASSSWLEEPQRIEIKDNNKIFWGEMTFQAEFKEVSGTDLKLIYLESGNFFYQGFIPIIIFSIMILIIGVGLAFVNYRKQSMQMVEDMNQITHALQQVEKGNLDISIQLEVESEFMKIADAVNKMTIHLKRYIENEYLMKIQQQKAEYRALQSQINPHFLYNTLNGLVALNRMGEKKILERSIIGLSKLFRYVCSKQEFTMVQEEIRFLEDYLKLEKLKYGERLEYIIWVDEKCKEKEIPKLLLQPIVENCIIHGMGDTGKSVMICIMAKTVNVKGIGNMMLLTVRDNGVGFIREKSLGQNDFVGMDNVRARTELFCRNAVFQCSSKLGEGTKTTIVFPYEAEEEI